MASMWMKVIVRQVSLCFLSKLKSIVIWVSSESANAAGCKPVPFGGSRLDTYLAHQMIVSSAINSS